MQAHTGRVLYWAISWLFVLAWFPLADSSGQELVQGNELFPQYELSNIKAMDSSIGKVLSIDYKRTKAGLGAGKIKLRARSDDGKVSVLGVSLDQESGTIQLEESSSPFFADSFFSRHFNGGEIDGIEFYVAATLPEFDGIDFLISNSIRDGKLSSQVVARPPSETEINQLNAIKKSKLPPRSVPTGHSLTEPGTELVPGAPVMYATGGQWKPAIVVSSEGTSVKLKPDGSKVLVTLIKGPYISIANETKKKISKNPQQFSLNFQTLPNGNLVLDDDLTPIKDWSKLVKGTPLKRASFDKWEVVYFESIDDVFVHFYVKSPFGRWEFASRNNVAIQKRVLDTLENGNAAEKFAANIPTQDQDLADPSGFSSRDHFAEAKKRHQELFKKHQAMSAEMFARNRPGGSFDTSGLESDMDMDMDMDMDDSVFETEADSEELAKPESREWRDKQGKFKIEAVLVEQKKDRIRLKRSDGKIIEVLIEKLSPADVEFLKESNSENPFGNIVDESPLPPKDK